MSTGAVPEVVAGLTSRVIMAKGDVIFRAGAPARHVFFLVRGRVTLHRFGMAGEEVAIHGALAGEFFAEASLHSDRYHCTAVATAGGEALRIASADLCARLRADPACSMAWLAIVSSQLRQARARVERLSLRGAAERVTHLLMTEGRGPMHSHAMRGTVKELASELGLTHEALYRTLATMEREGVVVREGNKLSLRT